MNSILSKIVKALLTIIFIVGIVLIATLPWMLSFYFNLFPDYYGDSVAYRTFVIAFCITVGILGLWILLELIMIFRTLTDDPFIPANVSALKRMGYSAIAIAALFFAKCGLYATPLSFACGLAMMLCGLFSLVLSGVFKKAVEYKCENDLTI